MSSCSKTPLQGPRFEPTWALRSFDLVVERALGYTCSMSKNLQLAYLAGVFDGEGCVRIERKKPQGAQKTPKYTVMVTVQMSDKKVMQKFATFFGVKLSYRCFSHIKYKDKTKKPRKPAWRFQLHAKRAVVFLRQLLPFMVGSKYEQAKLCLEYYASVSNMPTCGVRINAAELTRRERYYERTRQLKRKT